MDCLKQQDAISQLFFNVVLEYVIRIIQVNQDGLKLNGTHQLLVYDDDDVNILEGSVHTTENAYRVFSNDNGLGIMLIKLSIWSCLEIMQDEVSI
jgi:hypothetical protein